MPFFDDIFVSSSTFDRFMMALEQVFKAAEEHHVKINPTKAIVGASRLPCCGYLVSANEISIDPARLGPVPTLRAPIGHAELRSFLGFAQHYASFIKHFPQLAAPLYPLERKGADFVWQQPQQQAFEAIRDAIAADPHLAQYRPGAALILRPDASTLGVGGTLFQANSDGDFEVLLYFGRKLIDAETRYSTIELECLAIVYGFSKARPYVHGPVTVVTDHSNRSVQTRGHKRNRRLSQPSGDRARTHSAVTHQHNVYYCHYY